ncbi:MAG: AMP-binding protein, partial [Sciscionella sp.]|nr:AMP-binding protein [Sciscionella sp.]
TGKSTPANYARARGSLYFGVPTIWSRVCADPVAAQALSTARLLVSGSAPLPVGVFRQLREFTGSAPVERYGMTETLITVSARADGQRRPGYVGTPIAGVRTRLASDDGTPVAHDGARCADPDQQIGDETVGVLEVCGPTVFSGYLGQPTVGGQSSTAESFTDDGWFRTGDVATIDADGWHRIVGRASTDLIKSGGYRIGAGEIEDALLAHPSVREAAVIGVPDDDLGQRIVGYVVASDNVTGSALIEFVANELSWHKRPREIRFVDSLPRNAMGKIQKKSLIDD